MANHNFYMNFPQSTCSTPAPTTTTSAIWSTYQSNTGSCWPTPYTAPGELEANLKTVNASTSERNGTKVNDSSDTKTTASDVTTTTAADTSATTPAADSEGKNTEVKIPKNAVELIVAAITACHTTTPTLTEIASHIHSTAAAYRDHELSTLVKMVQHHLHNNNPGFFLPVMSPAGHTFNNPNMARYG
ncbi:mucin-5AC-like [Littorina saxatilis]|uniref:mucin-5AC-like n=1 Tax=Littorina saxatilis TaxID=31220 RepID=UPI0038B43393